jgi:hypothetical protein
MLGALRLLAPRSFYGTNFTRPLPGLRSRICRAAQAAGTGSVHGMAWTTGAARAALPARRACCPVLREEFCTLA